MAGTLHEVVPTPLLDRFSELHRRLHELEPALVQRLRSRPTTLCHGDAQAGNIVLDAGNPGGVILIDWGFVQIAALGADLGDLLSLPHLAAGRHGLDPEACVDAYLRELAPDPSDEHHIRQAYRHQLVFRSLRWCAARARVRGKQLRAADVERICDAAEVLLAEHDEIA